MPGTLSAAINQVISGTGATNAIKTRGKAYAALIGSFTGSFTLQISFDQGSTWSAASKNSNGEDATYIAPIAVVIDAPDEDGVLFRWNCTALSAGTPTARISSGV